MCLCVVLLCVHRESEGSEEVMMACSLAPPLGKRQQAGAEKGERRREAEMGVPNACTKKYCGGAAFAHPNALKLF